MNSLLQRTLRNSMYATRLGFVSTCTAVVVATSSIVVAHAQTADEEVTISTPVEHDLYVAGRIVDIRSVVRGDVVAAGQQVLSIGPVDEDVIAAGETVHLRGSIGDDVRVAGREVSIGGAVGGHIVAAGQSVTLQQDASVGEWAWLAGERVVVRGHIGKELRVAGATIRVGGRIDGDVTLYGERISFEQDAIIGGDVLVHSDQQPVVNPAAQIGGTLTIMPLPARWSEESDWSTAAAVAAVAFLLLLFAYFWLLPGWSRQVAGVITSRPMIATGIGIVAVLVAPSLTLLLFASGVGIALALVLIAVVWVVFVVGLLSVFVATAVTTLRLIGRDDSRMLTSLLLVVATLAIALIVQIPFVGPILLLLAWIAGVGATVVAGHRNYVASR